MDDATRTKTDHQRATHEADAPWAPVLTIVHHPDREIVGRRCVLVEGEPLLIGRGGGAFGGGALNDPLLSRRHLEIVRDGGQRVRVRDLASRNQSFVNGAPVGAAELTFGAVVGVGAMLVLYHRAPAVHRSCQQSALVGVSAALGELGQQIELLAPRSITVLIQGETGTGKELVARLLHHASGRCGDFIAVNCGALSEGLLHSELFGHERGAFSGATQTRPGLVESARAGTLLLDEIGDAPADLQASLLRLLEQREYRPVGSDHARASDARFVAATHVDLDEAVLAGKFRRDLYGRLRRWVVRVPPLRERREDILPLARAFADRHGATDVAIDRSLALALLLHGWPENVRELEAVVEQAVVECDGGASLALSPRLGRRLVPPSDHRSEDAVPPGPLPRARERLDATELRARLRAAGNNATALARQLGIGRTTLYRWLKHAGVDADSLRDETEK